MSAQRERESNSEQLALRTLERRAIEAAIWGLPIVSVDAMRRAYFRDAEAQYNDVVFFSQPADWKFLVTTPNASARYVYINFNTRVEGPVVVEIPAAVGAGLFGSILDAWQVPLADVGPAGEDKGEGGRFLLLPPDHTDEVPPEYIPVNSKTYNCYALFRAISETSSAEDVAKVLGLVKKIRVYPLAQTANPPEQRYLDMYGKIFDGIVRFDESFYASLGRMIQEEPVQTHDAAIMNLLRSIGIEKDREFQPDDATREVLRNAAHEVHLWLMDRLPTYGQRYWPDGRWDIPAPAIGPESGFSWEVDGFLDADARAIGFFSFFAPPVKLGTGTFYLGTFFDSNGQRLLGESTYRLRVPPNVPANQFWAVTVYSHEEAAFIRELSRSTLDSYDQNMTRNGDGSVDIYFGPKPPDGQESNWVPTVEGKDWFPFFRFYGPEKPLLDKTWKLPDIELVK